MPGTLLTTVRYGLLAFTLQAGAFWSIGLALVQSPPLTEAAHEHNRKGIGLARQGDQLDAIREFREAIRLDPHFAEAYYNLGNSLDQIGDLEQATTAFRTAARLRPDSAQVHLGLAAALMDSYDLSAAIEELHREEPKQKAL